MGDLELTRDGLPSQPEQAPPNGFPLRHSPRLLDEIRQAKDGICRCVDFRDPGNEFRGPKRATGLRDFLEALPRIDECWAVLLVRILALRGTEFPDPHGRPQAHRWPQVAGGHDGTEVREDVQRPRRIRYTTLELVPGCDPKRQPRVDGVRKSTLDIGKRLMNDLVEFPAVSRTVPRRTDDIRREDRDRGMCASHIFCTRKTVHRPNAPVSGCNIPRAGRLVKQFSVWGPAGESWPERLRASAGPAPESVEAPRTGSRRPDV